MSHSDSILAATRRSALAGIRWVANDVPPYDIPRKAFPPYPLPKGFGKAAGRLGKGQRRK